MILKVKLIILYVYTNQIIVLDMKVHTPNAIIFEDIRVDYRKIRRLHRNIFSNNPLPMKINIKIIILQYVPKS